MTRKRYDAAYYKEMMAMKAGARVTSQGIGAKNSERMPDCQARNDHACYGRRKRLVLLYLLRM